MQSIVFQRDTEQLILRTGLFCGFGLLVMDFGFRYVDLRFRIYYDCDTCFGYLPGLLLRVLVSDYYELCMSICK